MPKFLLYGALGWGRGCRVEGLGRVHGRAYGRAYERVYGRVHGRGRRRGGGAGGGGYQAAYLVMVPVVRRRKEDVGVLQPAERLQQTHAQMSVVGVVVAELGAVGAAELLAKDERPGGLVALANRQTAAHDDPLYANRVTAEHEEALARGRLLRKVVVFL